MPVAPASMLRGTLNAHSKLFKGSYRSFSMPLSDSDSISSIETSDQALNFPESSVRIGRFSVCVLYLKSMLGTGILGLGDDFRCGIIPPLVISLVVMIITQLANWFLYSVTLMTECFSFEEISDAAFGKRYRKFTGVMFIIVCFGFVQFYFTMAVDQYAALVNHEIKVTQSTVYYNSLFVLLIYWIVTVIPLVVFVRTLRHLVVTSLIALSCVVLLIAYTIYVFVGQLKFDGGFDPYNQMVWGRNLAIGKTFQSFLLAYTFSPMVLNALRGLEGISVSGATKLSMGVMAAGFVVYAIFGIFPYFTLFDTNTGKTWLSYFSQPAETRFTGSRAFNIFSLVVALIFLDGSIIIYLQPGVESLMMLMNKNPREYPRLQIVLQLVCSLVLLILGVIHEHVNKVIVLVTDLACVCIIYGMPVIAYIRVKGLEDLKLFIMAIVIAIIGLICFGFSLWSSIDTW